MNRARLCGYVLCVSHSASANLLPLSDEELAATDGQAFISIDQYQQNNLDFTRVNFGLDAKVQLNADEVVYGEYPRAGEAATADIALSNFSCRPH